MSTVSGLSGLSGLRRLAKEAGVKNRSTLNKSELRLALGMEPVLANKKYERFCRGKINNAVIITLVNKKTGEKQEFTSIYKAAKAAGKNPGSISHQLNKNNGEIKISENIYFIHSDRSRLLAS